ncbi:hypothetical protein MUP77_12280 [Candidatus Bathyarchaeota archaeon]|nr:hypothetical protein [Candidatus Bathyarchaeota archaeon]
MLVKEDNELPSDLREKIEAYLKCPEETLTVEPYRKKDGSVGFRFVPRIIRTDKSP